MAHPCQHPKPGLQLSFLESRSAPLVKKEDSLEEGGLRDFPGTFEEYQIDLQKREAIEKEQKPIIKAEKKAERPTNEVYEAEKRRRADKKRANALERQIAALEEEITGLDAAIEENAKDHLALLPLLSEREEKGNQLEALYDEWAEISE